MTVDTTRVSHTVAELASRHGVSVKTVLGWIHAGELKALNVSRRLGAKRPSWRIPQAALEAFESLRTTTAAGGRIPQVRRKRAEGFIRFY
jgi:excisionase family DNA binding protein